MVDLVCPSCQQGLIKVDNKLECKKCGIFWDVRDGIPIFTTIKPYLSDGTIKWESDIVKSAKKTGWRNALDASLKYKGFYTYKWMGDDSRVDWSYLIPLNSSSVVLDAGSGWGTLSVPLAERVKEVVCLDININRLNFLTIRAEQDGIKNITAINSDILNVPLRENQFDLVFLNGVFEWVGLSSDKFSPLELQEMVLEKINKLLKPDGYIYIGIENRWGFTFFLGARDHNGLRFTSLLPRFLANIVQKWHGLGEYRALTHSINGYKKLLLRHNYKDIQFFAPLPQYRDPYYIVPLEKKNYLQYCFSNLIISKTYSLPKKLSLLAKAGLLFMKIGLFSIVRFMVPAYSIIGKKE